MNLKTVLWGAVLGCSFLTSGIDAGDTSGLQVRFDRMDDSIGLSHKTVYALQQDSEGFLWVGTADGLNRYDGYETRVFRHDPRSERSLGGNTVTAILEDRTGVLWVGTDHGLARIANRRDVERVPLMFRTDEREPHLISTLIEDRSAGLWVGTRRGLFHLAADRMAVDPIPGTESLRMVAVQQDPAGGLRWLAQDETGTFRLLHVPPDTTTAQPIDVDSWDPASVWNLDPIGRYWESAPFQAGLKDRPVLPLPMPSHSHVMIHRSGPDRVWVGTPRGLRYFESSTGWSSEIPLSDAGTSDLSSFVRSIYEDRSGTLWVGSHGGLFRHDPGIRRFRTMNHDGADPDSLSSNAISSIVQTDDGTLWVGTYGAGLNRIGADGRQVRHFRHAAGDRSSLSHDFIWSLHLSGAGRLYLGTANGLCSLDLESETITRHSLEDEPDSRLNVRDMDEDDQGRLWIAETSGLLAFDPATERLRRFPIEGGLIPAQRSLESLSYQAPRTLWLAADRRYLFRIDLTDNEATRYELSGSSGRPRGESIWTVEHDSKGTVWLGTGLGLATLDPGSRSLRFIYPDRQLPGSIVYSILEDGLGRLWLGTNQGLTRFDPSGYTQSFHNFTPADGLGNVEFNRRAAYRNPNGEMWFGGMDGLTYFPESEPLQSAYVAPTVLTELQVANREGTRLLNPAGLDAVELSHRDSTFSFEFSYLDYRNPGRNRYSYLLEGLDDNWSEPGHRRYARYTNVPPGAYRFRVRGRSGDLSAQFSEARLPLTISPPFWATVWFRGLMVLTLLAAATALYRYRVSRLLEMQRLRLQIAGDLHDDLGSNLSGIALTGEMVRQRPGLAEEERRQIDRITRTAQRMIQDVRDIVWFVDPGHDKLDDLLLKMKDATSMLLGELPYTFEADHDLACGSLGMEFRRQFFLAYKEILHNVTRHAGAARVEITIARRQAQLVLQVTDDGRGFDPDRAGTGHGLQSLERRAQSLGGGFRIEPGPERGSRAVFSGRIA